MRNPPIAVAAMASAAILMSYQVASRATRDTLFLSNFHVTSLPMMVAVASVLSILAAFAATRRIARDGPARFLPSAFLVSAVLTLLEWGLVLRQPGLGAIAVYLHVAAISPILISAFWALLSEQFDPRRAKRALGSIAAVGTLGGLAGGVLAERVTSLAGVATTLPALAIAQVLCAWSTSRLPLHAAEGTAQGVGGETIPALEAARRLWTTPYLRNLALLILGTSVSATLLDFVFKAQTFGVARQSIDLMRVFSVFYAGVAIATFAVQALLTRPALQRAGLARTIGTLPGAVVVGASAAALMPGPWSASVVRGLEAVLRGSLFRAGYELLYTPIPPAEKRATRTVVDVACDRLGDILGAGIIAFVVLLGPSALTSVLLAIAVLLAVATLALVARLEAGYVSSLEAGLRAGGIRLDPVEVSDMTTLSALDRTLRGATAVRVRADDEPAAPAVSREVPDLLRELLSKDPARARAALRAASPLNPALVPQTIQLLGEEDVAREALDALRPVALQHVGQLVDALLDPASDFALRRRIPGVLGHCPVPRAIAGLTRALADTRFEVRYRCGRALARLIERGPNLAPDPLLITAAVLREATLGRQVWQSQRLLDRLDEAGEDEAFVDAFLRERAGRSLEHVFTLLSLILPGEPLKIAFRGLHAGDPMLRGTALEYMESVLPHDIREVLWPHLEPGRPTRRAAGAPEPNREQVLDDLLRSNQSIQISLEALRRERRP